MPAVARVIIEHPLHLGEPGVVVGNHLSDLVLRCHWSPPVPGLEGPRQTSSSITLSPMLRRDRNTCYAFSSTWRHGAGDDLLHSEPTHAIVPPARCRARARRRARRGDGG